MLHDDLPLFAWTPPRNVIPFPAGLRIGHARKVAVQLSKARSNREADHVLTRAVQAYCRQMRAAGIPDEAIEKQEIEFLRLIDRECDSVTARWRPALPSMHGNDPKGAA